MSSYLVDIYFGYTRNAWFLKMEKCQLRHLLDQICVYAYSNWLNFRDVYREVEANKGLFRCNQGERLA